MIILAEVTNILAMIMTVMFAAIFIRAFERRLSAPYAPNIARRKADEAIRNDWLVRDPLALTTHGWVIRLESNDQDRQPYDLCVPEGHPDLEDFQRLYRLDTIRLAMSIDACCQSVPLDAGHYLRLAKDQTRTWQKQEWPANTHGSLA